MTYKENLYRMIKQHLKSAGFTDAQILLPSYTGDLPNSDNFVAITSGETQQVQLTDKVVLERFSVVVTASLFTEALLTTTNKNFEVLAYNLKNTIIEYYDTKRYSTALINNTNSYTGATGQFLAQIILNFNTYIEG